MPCGRKPDRVAVECLGSLARLRLNPRYFQSKYVSFAAVDRFGRSWPIDQALAAQCGYFILHDIWGNLEFRASLLSCYAQMVDDQHFTLTFQILAATGPDMRNAASLEVPVKCSYGPWQPREIVCEANYMEVSVRRNVPPIPDGVLQDQPEDWAAAFPEAKAGPPSLWQIVFHMDTQRKSMLVEQAHAVGYGVNTTDTRIVLRASYNATEAQKMEVRGIPFSAVRSSTFYKQRWMLLMVDTAVACPIDGVAFTNETITWTIPKDMTPLMAGLSNVKELHVEMGIDLEKLPARDIASRGYLLASDTDAITLKIPVGAPGGTYKSSVVDGQLVTSYKINPFVEHLWEDDRRGVTKHTILKEISTPPQLAPIVVTDGTNIPLQLFNTSVGTFLPDVELVSVQVDDSGPWSLPEIEKQGCSVVGKKHPNSSRDFAVQIPFDTPGVKKEYVSGDVRNYTINITLGFSVSPEADPFDVPVTLVVLVRDAVLPQATGSCDDEALYLVMRRGNVDEDWLPFVGDTLLTQEMAHQLGYSFHDNGTHLALRVPQNAAHVAYEISGHLTEIHSSGIVATFRLQLKDKSTQVEMIDFSVSCIFSPKHLIDCLPNGTMVISALKLVGIPDMKPSDLVLRDSRCRPALVTEEGATFIFNVSTCGTTRKFENATMTYENEVLYVPPGQVAPVYRLKCACQYLIGDALWLQYSPTDAPSPSILPGVGVLALALKLARDVSYRDFYQDAEYPVTQYLREPLHFQVELLHSQDPQLELFLEDCWATASPDRNSSPQWNIVTDSCENTEDSHQTVFHRVPHGSVPFPTHVKRFEVKMFTFIVNDQALQGQIFFHCSAVICDSAWPSSDALCARRCIPRRQRVGKFFVCVRGGMQLHPTGKSMSG
ncbi:zona pellucida sperm-binding protein 2-like [Eublepharis macularius]|uniref:Zona pellucida sperm-binding protein 2-like n=1 Tax=Eublepharis macularius TaxID=481883 RepID=A0AA97LL97_EUBMA|nr:zona pellucida sperm-binding protein 2-like [Eublepharis macularius]